MDSLGTAVLVHQDILDRVDILVLVQLGNRDTPVNLDTADLMDRAGIQELALVGIAVTQDNLVTVGLSGKADTLASMEPLDTAVNQATLAWGLVGIQVLVRRVIAENRGIAGLLGIAG